MEKVTFSRKALGINPKGDPLGLHNYTQYPRFKCGGVERSGYGLGIFGAGPMQDR